MTLQPGDEVGVGNWGTLSPRPLPAALPAAAPLRWWRAALQLELTRAHAGFPAGTVFLIGWVAADRVPLPTAAVEPEPTTTTTATTATTTTAPPSGTAPSPPSSPPPAKPPAAHPSAQHPAAHHTSSKATAKPPARKRSSKHKVPLVGQPLTVTPLLGPGARTFPVVGDVAWGDTYGAQRSDVPGGWHHGDDLFAPLGTPVVAVTDGTVFAVGWNRVGGWRLWLLDAEGNQYYYAHLSGYSALARNNHHVRRGQVLGFVGNTGDAITTWPHVHFEVHPNATLYLGYDGAVDPTHYLAAWTRLGRVASVPPPVPLPSGAPSGEGAIKDFRALLAIRPMKVSPEVAATAAAQSKPTSQLPPHGATALSLRRGPAHGGSEGEWPIMAGIALLGAALVALFFTWRAGRRRPPAEKREGGLSLPPSHSTGSDALGSTSMRRAGHGLRVMCERATAAVATTMPCDSDRDDPQLNGHRGWLRPARAWSSSLHRVRRERRRRTRGEHERLKATADPNHVLDRRRSRFISTPPVLGVPVVPVMPARRARMRPSSRSARA